MNTAARQVIRDLPERVFTNTARERVERLVRRIEKHCGAPLTISERGDLVELTSHLIGSRIHRARQRRQRDEAARSASRQFIREAYARAERR